MNKAMLSTIPGLTVMQIPGSVNMMIRLRQSLLVVIDYGPGRAEGRYRVAPCNLQGDPVAPGYDNLKTDREALAAILNLSP